MNLRTSGIALFLAGCNLALALPHLEHGSLYLPLAYAALACGLTLVIVGVQDA